MENKFASEAIICKRLVHTAYDHRLVPSALHHEVITPIINHTNSITAGSELVSFVNELPDLFLVKTSYIYKPEENVFILILHIPLVPWHNLMQLFYFIPLPVHFNFTSDVVTPDVGKNSLIVVGHSEAYQTLSSSDLQVVSDMK